LHQTGPLVTLDAGPNVHLLFRNEDLQHKTQLLGQLENYEILEQIEDENPSRV